MPGASDVRTPGPTCWDKLGQDESNLPTRPRVENWLSACPGPSQDRVASQTEARAMSIGHERHVRPVVHRHEAGRPPSLLVDCVDDYPTSTRQLNRQTAAMPRKHVDPIDCPVIEVAHTSRTLDRALVVARSLRAHSSLARSRRGSCSPTPASGAEGGGGRPPPPVSPD